MMHSTRSQDGNDGRVENNYQHNRSSRNTKRFSDEQETQDPYTSYVNFENYLNMEEDSTGKDTSIEEQRILAEIEYFREKAAYYRMQKNLVALQAKKAKFELEQLSGLG